MARAEAQRVHRAFRDLQRKIQVTFTERDPYRDFEELRHDVETNRRMFVYMGESDTPLWDAETNWMARAVHDWDHVVNSTDFSIEGETATYRAAAAKMPGLAPLYLSEIVLQAAVQTYTGEFHPQKLVLPSAQVVRIANSLKGPGDSRRRQSPAAMVWYAAGMLRFMDPRSLMVHLAAAGYDEEEALIIVDAADMLASRRL